MIIEENTGQSFSNLQIFMLKFEKVFILHLYVSYLKSWIVMSFIDSTKNISLITNTPT